MKRRFYSSRVCVPMKVQLGGQQDPQGPRATSGHPSLIAGARGSLAPLSPDRLMDAGLTRTMELRRESRLRRQQDQRRRQAVPDPASRPAATTTTARLAASRPAYRQTFTANGYVRQHPSSSRHTKHGHASFIIAAGPLRCIVASDEDRDPRHVLHHYIRPSKLPFTYNASPAVSAEHQEQQGQRELNRLAAPNGHGLGAHPRPSDTDSMCQPQLQSDHSWRC